MDEIVHYHAIMEDTMATEEIPETITVSDDNWLVLKALVDVLYAMLHQNVIECCYDTVARCWEQTLGQLSFPWSKEELIAQKADLMCRAQEIFNKIINRDSFSFNPNNLCIVS